MERNTQADNVGDKTMNDTVNMQESIRDAVCKIESITFETCLKAIRESRTLEEATIIISTIRDNTRTFETFSD